MNLNITPFKNISFQAVIKPQNAAEPDENTVVFKNNNSKNKDIDKDVFERSLCMDPSYQHRATSILGMRERSMLPEKKDDVTPELREKISSMTSDEILKYAGIDVQRLLTGAKAISCYAQPSPEYTFSDLGVDEEKLLQDVEMVMGDASFSRSSKTNIYPIKDVHGTLYLRNSNIKNLRSLRSADNVYLPEGTKPKDFGLRPERVHGEIKNAIN